MKTNKKLKTSLISTLTLIASAISVVACGSKKDEGDQNYQTFVSSIKKIDLNEKASGLINNSYLKQLSDKLHDYKDLKFSVNKLNEDNIMLYNRGESTKYPLADVKPIKLTDLKDGKITINNTDNLVHIKLDNDDLTLDKIYFASNFNLNVAKDKNSMSFNDITVFFGFNSVGNFNDLKLTNQSNLVVESKDEPDYTKMTFTINAENKGKKDFGYQDNTPKNSMLYDSAFGDKDINWNIDNPIDSSLAFLYNADLSVPISLEINNKIVVKCDNVVAEVNVNGKGKTTSDADINLESKFYCMFSLNKNANFKNGNFLVNFTTKTP